MDYDAIAAHFLIPGPDVAAAPKVPASPARRLRDAVEAIATIGWWSREAAAASVELGHGFFDGYVWGRAASLGADVATPVVVAAFGVFDAGMLGAAYAQGRAISSRDEILAARATGASAGLARVAASIDPAAVTAFGDLLLAATAELDGAARPLFGALRSLPTPDGPFGRAWRAAELVREHRGDGHLGASIAAGLDMPEMNALTEAWLGYPLGEYSSTRGFSPAQLRAAADRLRTRGWFDGDDRLTDAGRSARNAIEDRTDASQAGLVAALGDDCESVIASGNAIAEAVLSAHAAPADPRKRAAG